MKLLASTLANSMTKVPRYIKRGGAWAESCAVCDAESIWHVPQRQNCIMVDRNFASRAQVCVPREYRWRNSEIVGAQQRDSRKWSLRSPQYDVWENNSYGRIIILFLFFNFYLFEVVECKIIFIFLQRYPRMYYTVSSFDNKLNYMLYIKYQFII